MAERIALRRFPAGLLLRTAGQSRGSGIVRESGSAWDLVWRELEPDRPGRAGSGEAGDIGSRVAALCEQVRTGGEAALRELADRFDGRAGLPLWYGPADFAAALGQLPEAERSLLERSCGRVTAFAQAQKSCLDPLCLPVPGGYAGHEILPLDSAGCYIPGGRHPLVSSAIMTLIPARVAGVGTLVAACPAPDLRILAVCALARVDSLLAAGGAHAIAALGYGTERSPACAIVVGPGNRWVAEAKRQLARTVAIDAVAGPSELLVIADGNAKPDWIAADLLAQAEHDPDARVMLIADSEALICQVEAAIARQVEELSTREVICQSLKLALSCVAERQQFAELANAVAPEHLSLMVADASGLSRGCRHAGAVFLGGLSAEVFGDYGVGPNHTLPTSGQARYSGGLSVFIFLRVRTWLGPEELPQLATDRREDFDSLCRDVMDLAGMEGLPAHAASAQLRLAVAE